MRKLPQFLPAGILALGCAFVWKARNHAAVPLSGPIHSVLADYAGYDVTNQDVSLEEQRVAGMSNYVARAYRRDSALVFATLVSYYDRQTQGRSIHSPRNCLPGAGWEIVTGETRMVAVDGGTHPVNRYVLRNGAASAIAYYWYQGRGRVTANEYRVKWNLLRDAAFLGRTEEALVRVIVPISRQSSGVNGAVDIAAADTIALTVVPHLMSEVRRVLPTRGAAARTT